jgi:hypothetical protein
MFAPINLYVIVDSVTSSCIPICLYLSVLLARYLQTDFVFCLLASTVVVHTKMKSQNEVVGFWEAGRWGGCHKALSYRGSANPNVSVMV